jgi:hypothetical protein
MAIDPWEVASRSDLAAFLEQLAEQAASDPDSIANRDLASYLSGAAGWAADLHGYFLNKGEPVPDEPTWALVAALFAAAAVYE